MTYDLNIMCILTYTSIHVYRVYTHVDKYASIQVHTHYASLSHISEKQVCAICHHPRLVQAHAPLLPISYIHITHVVYLLNASIRQLQAISDVLPSMGLCLQHICLNPDYILHMRACGPLYVTYTLQILSLFLSCLTVSVADPIRMNAYECPEYSHYTTFHRRGHTYFTQCTSTNLLTSTSFNYR